MEMIAAEMQFEESTHSQFMYQLRLSNFKSADEFLRHLLAIQQLAWSSLKSTVPARTTTDNYSQLQKTNNILEHTNATQFEGTAVIDPKVQKSTISGRGNKRMVPVRSSIKLEPDAISTSHAEQEVWQFQSNVCETNAESDDSAGESSQIANNDEGFAVNADPHGSANFDTIALVCNECDPPKSFVRLNNLKRHMNIHCGGFQCLECPKKFDRKERLEAHKLKHTRGKKPFPCKMCGKSFTRNEGLVKHKWRSHEVKPVSISCNICGTNFQKKSERTKHLATAHPSGPFKCVNENCGAQFKKSSSFHAHINFCGSSNPKFKCGIQSCSKVFNNKSLLDQHKSKHKEPQLICDHCGKKFRWLSSYNAHLKAVRKNDTVQQNRENTDCESKEASSGMKTGTMLLRSLYTETRGSKSEEQLRYNSTQALEIMPYLGQTSNSNGILWQPPTDVDVSAVSRNEILNTQQHHTPVEMHGDGQYFPQFHPSLPR